MAEYTHKIDVKTSKGVLSGNITLNGGTAPEWDLKTKVQGELEHDEKIHRVIRALLELNRYSNIEKFKITLNN
jgi:hypothetical protein